MSDVFRCDYCSSYADRDDAEIFWEPIDTLADGRMLWLPAVYCSAYCGRTATARAGAGRG